MKNPKILPEEEHFSLEKDSYLSGLQEIPAEKHEQFIQLTSQTNLLKEQISLLDADIEKQESELPDESVIFQYYEYCDTKKAVYESQYLLLEDVSNKIQELKNKLQTQDGKQTDSLLAGLFYFFAGLIFIVGEVVISHEIVAYALNIKNPFESWTFALGLAMLSFVLKPAYDRLIEQPYQQKELSKTTYIIFKVGIVIFVIVTLCVLGFFRYEAYQADARKAFLNEQIHLQEEKISDLLSEQNLLQQQLVDSKNAMWSFILTSILFAVAGSIMLSIGLKVLTGYFRNWIQLPRQRQKIIAELQDREREYEKNLRERTTAEFSLVSAYKEKIEKYKQAQDKLGQLREERKKLFLESFAKEQEIKGFLALLSYKKGLEDKKNEQTEKVTEKIEEVILNTTPEAETAVSSNDTPEHTISNEPLLTENALYDEKEFTDDLKTMLNHQDNISRADFIEYVFKKRNIPQTVVENIISQNSNKKIKRENGEKVLVLLDTIIFYVIKN